MTAVDSFKHRVRPALKRTGFALSYSQHLDVACALVFGAKSWNHFCATPDIYTDALPSDVGTILARLQSVERVIPGSAATLSPDQWQDNQPNRLRDWERIAGFWLACLGQTIPVSSAFSCLFPNIETQIEIEELDDIDDWFPYRHFIREVLSEWFVDRYCGGVHESQSNWDRFFDFARQDGWSVSDSEFYRELCFESHFFGWSLSGMIRLGLFDLPLGEGPSLAILRMAGGRAALEQLHREENPPEILPWYVSNGAIY